jgi:K+ transporter
MTSDEKAGAVLRLAALGVVFGDIGTSPLYTLKVVVDLTGGHPAKDDILGFVSLIIWTLIIIPTTKYVSFAMRVDNNGEGGILALMSLLGAKRYGSGIVAAGLFGAALIYADGAITPAISVLSALEGLGTAAPLLTPYAPATTSEPTLSTNLQTATSSTCTVPQNPQHRIRNVLRKDHPARRAAAMQRKQGLMANCTAAHQ